MVFYLQKKRLYQLASTLVSSWSVKAFEFLAPAVYMIPGPFINYNYFMFYLRSFHFIHLLERIVGLKHKLLSRLSVYVGEYHFFFPCKECLLEVSAKKKKIFSLFHNFYNLYPVSLFWLQGSSELNL